MPDCSQTASMEPVGIALAWHDAEGVAGAFDAVTFSSYASEPIDVEATFDGEVLELAVVPRIALTLEFCQVELRHAFKAREQVLLNGYQSWTTTREQPSWSRTRGLEGVSRKVVGKYVLDGGGDYRFADYANKPGQLHGWTYATFRESEGIILVGSLDESRGLTLIRTDAAHGQVLLQTEPPMRLLAAGERVVLCRYAILRGPLDECYDRWFALSGIRARTTTPLIGYTSWYRRYDDISETALIDDLCGAMQAFGELEEASFSSAEAALSEPGSAPAPCSGEALIEEVCSGGEIKSRPASLETAHCAVSQALGPELAPLVLKQSSVPLRPRCVAASQGSESASSAEPAKSYTKLFQIDDGYCKVGDWFAVDQKKFPHGLSPLAHVIRDCGFMPGLWVAPFVCERDSRLFLEHNDWLLRDEAGNACQTGCHWSGAYALDIRKPAVRAYVQDVLSTMVHEWGFGLLKVDFLYAACMIAHDGMNRGQLMADALQLIREAVGDTCLILACGVPLGPAFGVVDYCRIGCDVGLDWTGPLYMWPLHRERVSTRNSLGNTYWRAPLDGRAFGNDPDVFFLRDDVMIERMFRKYLLLADASLGSVLLTSDDMGTWDDSTRKHWIGAVKMLVERKAAR